MSSRGICSEALTADEAFALLPHVLGAIATAPWWQCAAERLGERIAMLSVAENQLAAAQVAAVGEGMNRGLPAEAGARDGAAWLRGLVPLTPQAAGLRADLAEQLAGPDLEPTRSEFAAGSIGIGHAGVLSRCLRELGQVPEVDATTWAEAQRLLLESAQQVDASQLGKVALHLRRRLHPDGQRLLVREEDCLERQREATLVQDSSGMWVLNAVLPSIGGAMARAALDPLAAPHPAADGTPDPRTARQRRADALIGVFELSLAQRPGRAGSLPTRHGSPARVLVTGELEALLADVPAGGPALTGLAPAVLETGEPGGWEISALSFQTLSCDAELVPVLLDESGRPLDVGQTRYRFPPRIRTAIALRDQHCTYPSCQAPPAWCHTHHLVPYGRGGPTSEANGTLLCGRHHRFIHARGWTGELVDGRVRWRPPSPDDPSPPPNAFIHQFAQELRRLAHRWLARNPDLRNTS